MTGISARYKHPRSMTALSWTKCAQPFNTAPQYDNRVMLQVREIMQKRSSSMTGVSRCGVWRYVKTGTYAYDSVGM